MFVAREEHAFKGEKYGAKCLKYKRVQNMFLYLFTTNEKIINTKESKMLQYKYQNNKNIDVNRYKTDIAVI